MGQTPKRRNCRSAYRNNNNPGDRNNNLGFRVACSAPALFYVRTGRWESIGRIFKESRSVPVMRKHPKNKRVGKLGKSWTEEFADPLNIDLAMVALVVKKEQRTAQYFREQLDGFARY